MSGYATVEAEVVVDAAFAFSVNQFEPLVKLNLDENPSFLGTL